MTQLNSNLRKAAIFVRSLDADTAASMLAQLSSEEAVAIREAIRRLGPLDANEQADVLAELQRGHTANGAKTMGGVELKLSSAASDPELVAIVQGAAPSASNKRFEFLEEAPVSALVTFLAREHAQTIAVVLSYLEPARAAEVLASLPQTLQADTVERLAALGESDAESVTVLEKELADWVAKRATSRRTGTARVDKVGAILAAADGTTRESIVRNLMSRNAALAERIAPVRDRQLQPVRTARREQCQEHRRNRVEVTEKLQRVNLESEMVRVHAEIHPISSAQTQVSSPKSHPSIDFDHLIHLDSRTLAMVLRDVDSNVLALALAGSRDDLVDRICDQMPKRIARNFRRELRRLGPTRLSDVETAQRAVARSAAQHLAAKRRGPAVAHA